MQGFALCACTVFAIIVQFCLQLTIQLLYANAVPKQNTVQPASLIQQGVVRYCTVSTVFLRTA